LEGDSKQIAGVILLNLGGPDSLRAVRPFLFNLFSDRDIIRLGPSFLQKPLAWMISAFRSGKTKEMYRQIGGKSPILDITMSQAGALEKALNQRSAVSGRQSASQSLLDKEGQGELFKVYVGMRYWHPFMKDTVNEIIRDGARRLIVLSLYPHYSKATTGSSIADFDRVISKLRTPDSGLQIRYIDRWYDFPAYIDALAELAAQGISEFRDSDSDILYSAHSLPESFIHEGDPYLDHIKATIELVNRRLSEGPYNMKRLKWHLSFQSKSGPVKWLEPATEEMIKNLAHRGCKNLFVVPISFVSDHIETLYEIDILYRKLAEKHGMILKRCRALNTSENFILAMKQLVMAKMTDTL
jgi:ferrochelatase